MSGPHDSHPSQDRTPSQDQRPTPEARVVSLCQDRTSHTENVFQSARRSYLEPTLVLAHPLHHLLVALDLLPANLSRCQSTSVANTLGAGTRFVASQKGLQRAGFCW
eukprot:1118948-Rhodomonas_salina.1